MRLVRLNVIVMLTLAGCSPVADPSTGQIRTAQDGSDFGPIRNWKLSPANWSKNTQAMRDRAYRFCMERTAATRACFAEQDHSLIAANHAESNARRAVAGDSGDPHLAELRRHPEAFDDVRRHCFSIYDDAGSADARVLGPCLSAATGSDYFGIISVP